MSPEELEFSIAQYADGTLPDGDRAALEGILRRDAAARALLAEYRRLGDVLKSAGAPAVDWDKFAGRIEDAIDRRADTALPGDVEFALARWADGSLDDADRPAVVARLASDPAARIVASEYGAVDALLRDAAGPLPAVRWDALAVSIAAAADRPAAGVSEDDEFALAQYADGTLAADRREGVEAKLDADPAARHLLAEYAGLDAALKQVPLPAVEWDRLAAHLSAAVAGAGRDTRSFKLPAWIRSPMKLALAASVLIAASVGVRLIRPPSIQQPTPLPAPTALAQVDVAGPEAAAGVAVADISVGPPPGGAGSFAEADETGGIVTRPTRAIVAAGAVAYAEGPGAPF